MNFFKLCHCDNDDFTLFPTHQLRSVLVDQDGYLEVEVEVNGETNSFLGDYMMRVNEAGEQV